jgi:hypothetical protein
MPNSRVRVKTGKHDRTNLHAADAALAIELHCQCLRGKLVIGNVWEDLARVDIDSMSAGGLDGWNASFVDAGG